MAKSRSTTVYECIVPTCNNIQEVKVKQLRTFFSFPKDPKLLNEWIAACCLEDTFIPNKRKRVCSDHFAPDVLEDKFKADFLNLPPKRLNKNAVPTLNLPDPKPKPVDEAIQPQTHQVRFQRECALNQIDEIVFSISEIIEENPAIDKRPPIEKTSFPNFKNFSTLEKLPPSNKNQAFENVQKNVSNITLSKLSYINQSNISAFGNIEENSCSIDIDKLLFTDINQSMSITYANEGNSEFINKLPSTNIIEESSEDSFEEIKRDLEFMTKQCEKLAKCHHEDKKLNAELTKKLKESTKREDDMKKELKELTNNINIYKIKFEQKMKEVLKSCLSSKQIDIILNKGKKTPWTPEDITRAFTLRNFSEKGYNYLRTKCNYPLPLPSLLSSLTKNINLRNGILDDVIKIMEISGTKKNDIQKCCILCFDRIKGNQDLLEHHAYMQVIMVRGIFESYKHPIFVGFDTKVTQELLLKLITQLHEIGYNVVGCVSHCESCNLSVWKDFKINIEKTYMLHPVTKEKVFFFPDARQTLKLICYWLLNSEFVFKDGSIINQEPIKEMLKDTSTEINSLHNISTEHFICRKLRSGNVDLAAELMSKNTAKALSAYHVLRNNKAAFRLAEFISLVSDWFDVMNSSLRTSLDIAKPFKNNKNQVKTLIDMVEMMINMTCAGKKSLLLFQKAVIIATKSVQGLFIEMKRKYKITSLLTHRLSYDCIEKFFSQLASKENTDNPVEIEDEKDGYLPISEIRENNADSDESSPLVPMSVDDSSNKTDHDYTNWKVSSSSFVSTNWLNEFKTMDQGNKLEKKILLESLKGMTQDFSNDELINAYCKTRVIIRNSYLKQRENEYNGSKRKNSGSRLMNKRAKTCK